MRFDGLDFLSGRCDPMPPANTPCINADLAVLKGEVLRPSPVERTRKGLAIGQGVDLESARAIGRLHAGHDDYIHFDAGVTVRFFWRLKEGKGPRKNGVHLGSSERPARGWSPSLLSFSRQNPRSHH